MNNNFEDYGIESGNISNDIQSLHQWHIDRWLNCEDGCYPLPAPTTIDSTDIQKDKLDLDFLFDDEQLQRKFRAIAKHFKVNKQ